MLPNLEQELAGLAAESIGWLPLENGAYLHISSEGKDDRVVITGLPDAGLDGENVLLLV
ncbi:MAG TPA: hypothetical protein PKY33_08815 [Limnohabitans sp.]|jgi:hypothetical protein|uniref:hypothetical protein n=1 Tax=Limnohabitans sp. TaxID=1907725 RepID=UPI0026D917E6|nr:hypothetical protein [Limnohabitans sp.]HQR86836.1 hypothetical protein [Limnohabitans sp.]HQS27067.1 hypothetical protein [Limnohabitans sp.]